ncbi:MAG: flagellar type III secretion system protein FlhB [Proteobacteria bacterium]|nr:flagellar type III secretion system protein FlhB [Pseudomonadota bacterium]
MADTSTEDKSEKASAQKLRKAREQGQTARSRDWATALGLLVSLKLLLLLMPGYLADFRALFGVGFAALDGDATLDNLWSIAFTTTMLLLAKMLAPLFAVPLIVSIGALVPGGWVFSGENLKPKLDRLNPLSYAQRLTQPKHLFELATTVVKATALGLVLWHVVSSGREAFMQLQAQPLDQALAGGAGLMVDGIMALCAVFVVFALIDVPVQHFIYLRGQRMGRREMKEEHKSTEGRPEVRQRIRQIQQQLARRGVRKTVPGADVVIVNPQHYAVALKYDAARAEAPFVVAKGVDEMALYIREVAAEHKVEIVPMPPLARAIYNTSQVNQQIPAPLYRAVAQVLGYVLQLKAFRNGQRPQRPDLPDPPPVPRQFLDTETDT